MFGCGLILILDKIYHNIHARPFIESCGLILILDKIYLI